ncbi:hypothetical protein QM480_04475 [Flectobacillus sp. DC10W]|uniref:Uncharacterized protein n=1 Tax=Flectobacillus longus TaxID=2984207 RepID=A0ABT6YJ00_9BACT|nr:hypothetical protein [Flectobacillus longus]MDI9863564.1 hypothetical protein [Flectobacillus longus]
MSNFMLKIILSIRDKSWFYSHQLYPDDTAESNYKDFKVKFSLFFIPPLLFIVSITCRLFVLSLDKPVHLDSHDYRVVFPLVILFGGMFYYVYSLIFKKIEKFPIDETNDLGINKNRIFIISVISLEMFIVFFILYLLFPADK